MEMGFVGLLNFAVACFDVLAWPLFAVCYPLCVSIQAIEANSISDTKKLITYWVSFSLILLFEYAFEKLLEWLPSWDYIKLMIVFCLVMPHFHGSLYVYKHLVHPCLSVDPESVINQLIKLKDFFFKEDNLLAEMERDVKENGTCALENPIASKVARSNHVVRENMAVPDIDLPNFENQKIANNSIKVLDITQEKEVISPHQVRYIEPNLPMVDNRASAIDDLKEIATAVEAGKNLPEIPASEQVQKQWTCAICQLTVHSETILNSHLQGRRHKAACELLNAKKQKPKSEAIPSSAGKKSNVPSSTAAAAHKDLGVSFPSMDFQNDWTCTLCNIKFKSEIGARSHVYGKRHKAACEELKAKVQALKNHAHLHMTGGEAEKCTSNCGTPTKYALYEEKEQPGKPESLKNKGAEIKNNTPWWCIVCNVSCTSQGDLDCHLAGNKHLSRTRELNSDGWE